MLNVFYSRQGEKFLEKAEKEIAKRVIKKIEELRENPFPREAIKVEGYKEKTLRVRTGHYRILYEVDQSNNHLGIVKIDKRDRVYD